jgi:chemotaxis protein CheY-P-specific phosphatase CheC
MTARTPIPARLGSKELRSLAELGAERAARVLAQLTETRVDVGPLRPGAALAAPPFDTGVIFRMEGGLGGHLGLFLDRASRRSLVRLLLDEEESETPPEMVASALCEVANIVASQTASAIADALDTTISLSVPQLALESAPTRFGEARGAAHGGFAVASELASPAAELRALLVFAPDA